MAPQAAAVSSLRTINTAAATYSSTYNNGYPARLALLGTPKDGGTAADCNAAGLIDPVLAAGRKNGYVFDYKPGPAEKKPVAGCPPGIKSYAVTARPIAYSKKGRQSYFTDESGVIRFTEENRVPTVKDPPVGG